MTIEPVGARASYARCADGLWHLPHGGCRPQCQRQSDRSDNGGVDDVLRELVAVPRALGVTCHSYFPATL